MRILLVEDELLIAMEQRLYLEDVGHEVVGPAMDLREVRAMEAEGPFDLALVDVHLANASSGLDVARYLEERNVACLFVTSFPEDVTGRGVGAGCLMKPFSRADLLTAVECCDPEAGDRPTTALPRNLVLFDGGSR